ncbi:sarcosine oxidase subunit beta family protein [Afifella sp. IM 167]|uniref:sarcosine oxidase subunit beta family protein n=1 Tax=Afifella sp. IM 167 TaxID=2033586 RepID=UPI001CC99BD6|nr:sarcosine oxidase subunit beta family protein [Afifella sp. IM 167]MBZ8134013.1 sarcosine oxidase subunit beta [Afifella sp. IM 167]
MAEYSALRVITEGLRGNRGWKPAWRKAEPKPRYDVIVVGGGGHGLATAYYLAKNHGLRHVAVVEAGPIGLGNVGRNTTIVRSNYLLPENHDFYEWSLKLWEGLSHELNYNVMFSQRGVLNLAHSPEQMDVAAERGNAMRLAGIDADLIGRDEVAQLCPGIDLSEEARFPVAGGLIQRRAGTARHDAVAWGYAHAADRLGVDIIENAPVTDFITEGGTITGVVTPRGEIRADKVGVAVAGMTSEVMRMAGVEGLPIESHVLQAFVSEPVKPLVHCVVTYGAGHMYVSQSDKGGLVFGGSLDFYNSYARRGNLANVHDTVSELLAIFPNVARIKLLRSWGGIMDMSMDGSPIITPGPLPGLYLNCGWCYGGFKATPASGWCFAHTIARDEPHALNAGFTLSRFAEGRHIDEAGTGAVPGLH